MAYCGSTTSVKQAPGHKVLASLKCRSWGCADCQPKRRRRLIADAVRGRPDTFITLTLDASWKANPEDGVKELARAWRLIRKRHTRAHQGEKLPFLAVVELTKAGTPHLHILCRSRWIDQRWLSDAMREITGSFIVDISRTKRRDQVGSYCAKYVGKQPTRVGTTKRYWKSQDFLIDPRKKPFGDVPGRHYVRPWNSHLSETVSHFEGIGFYVRWLDPDTAVVWNPNSGCDPPPEWFL